MSFGIVLFVAAILLVVMVHESGHFVMAKRFGFKATKFFVGFGPTLWSFHRGETEYGIKALPLGGFVKIIGMNPYEEVPAQDVPRSYPNKPRWQRMLLLLGGPATHWPLAFVVLLVSAMTIGYPTGEPANEIAAVDTVMEGESTPALDAGLRPGDRIVAVGDRATSSWEAISGYIRARGGEEATFVVEREGRRREVRTRLARVIFSEDGEVVAYAAPGEDIRMPRGGEEASGFLGISPKERFRTLGLGAATTDSARVLWLYTERSVFGISEIFRQTFNGDLWEALQERGARAPDEGPVGVVGISRMAGQSVARGEFFSFVHLVVFLTIFVGLMNLLPLPPLDGGHLAVLAYEKVTGEPVDLRKVIPIAAAVISFFLVLSIAALYLDIARPIDIPF